MMPALLTHDALHERNKVHVAIQMNCNEKLSKILKNYFLFLTSPLRVCAVVG